MTEPSKLEGYNETTQKRLAEAEHKAGVNANEVKGTGGVPVVVQKTRLPVPGIITSKYGPRTRPKPGASAFHIGIDLRGSTGTPILSMCDGVVVFAGIEGGYGETVKVRRDDGVIVRYAHCSRLFVHVRKSVNRGQKLAEVGATGTATGPHLHLDVQDSKGDPVNPGPNQEKWIEMRLWVPVDETVADMRTSITTAGFSHLLRTAVTGPMNTIIASNRVRSMSQITRNQLTQSAAIHARKLAAAEQDKLAHEVSRADQLDAEKPELVEDITLLLYEDDEF